MDKSIEFADVIMKLSDFTLFSPCLPTHGYTIKYFSPGDELEWAQIEYECLEFDSPEIALDTFRKRYYGQDDLLRKGLFFIIDESGRYCGTCMAWVDPDIRGDINALHWLAVRPSARGLGLSKILISEVIRNLGENKPIYLHSQTWSYKAISIYHSLGFRLLKSESFASYKNDYYNAIKIIEPKMAKERFKSITYDAE